MIEYAAAMSRTPQGVSEELFDRMRSQFDERQLVELTSCIAWENYRARFDHAFGIESEGFDKETAVTAPGLA